MVIVDDIKLDIPQDVGKDFLEKIIGPTNNPAIKKLLEEKKSLCAGNITPKAIYDTFEIDRVEDEFVYFKSGDIFRGPNVSKILSGSVNAIIFIYTLGSSLDDALKKESSSGDALSTIIMDAISTSLLVVLNDYIDEIIRKDGIGEKGWDSTCRYSPGQHKWTIEEQKKIFGMVDGNRIGVRLNESYLMIPFMSGSGVYGFGPAGKINRTRSACDLCPRKDCVGRR
ncbi:MAG: hypothetical protein JW770_00665 [Actinobacteria bacterium]|nr:hypothetical protein [Actinomycetota bacterium]